MLLTINTIRSTAVSYISCMLNCRYGSAKPLLCYEPRKKTIQIWLESERLFCILTPGVKQFGDMLHSTELEFDILLNHDTKNEYKFPVYWGDEKKKKKQLETGVKFVHHLRDFASEYNIESIIVVTDTLSIPAIKYMQTVESVFMTKFTYEETSIDRSIRHMYDPHNHFVIDPTTRKNLLQYRSLDQFCTITREDPLVKYYGYRPGDILQIEDEDVMYRLVV
jgi:DNA-directed RNA polymerase subunit H (RpoH/RPB5)